MNFMQKFFGENGSELSERLQDSGFTAEQAAKFLSEAASGILNAYKHKELELIISALEMDKPTKLLNTVNVNAIANNIGMSSEQVTAGFEVLAPVMSKEGDASAGDKIPMTSPVLEEKQAKGWRYSFVLPADYTLENAPLPSNPEVKLAVIPGKKVAVIRYTGSWKEQTMREKSQKLVEWIQANGLERLSKPRSARYDPPWTLPFLRRNEIMIDVN